MDNNFERIKELRKQNILYELVNLTDSCRILWANHNNTGVYKTKSGLYEMVLSIIASRVTLDVYLNGFLELNYNSSNMPEIVKLVDKIRLIENKQTLNSIDEFSKIFNIDKSCILPVDETYICRDAVTFFEGSVGNLNLNGSAAVEHKKLIIINVVAGGGIRVSGFAVDDLEEFFAPPTLTCKVQASGIFLTDVVPLQTPSFGEVAFNTVIFRDEIFSEIIGSGSGSLDNPNIFPNSIRTTLDSIAVWPNVKVIIEDDDFVYMNVTGPILVYNYQVEFALNNERLASNLTRQFQGNDLTGLSYEQTFPSNRRCWSDNPMLNFSAKGSNTFPTYGTLPSTRRDKPHDMHEWHNGRITITC